MVSYDRRALARLCKRHDVARLRVFGSAARGEERPESDVDLLVDFRSPRGFFGLIRLERELEELFGRPVDIVTERGLSPYFRDSILESTAVLYDGTE